MKESCRNESILFSRGIVNSDSDLAWTQARPLTNHTFYGLLSHPFVVSSDSLALGINISWKEMPEWLSFHASLYSVRVKHRSLWTFISVRDVDINCDIKTMTVAGYRGLWWGRRWRACTVFRYRCEIADPVLVHRRGAARELLGVCLWYYRRKVVINK